MEQLREQPAMTGEELTDKFMESGDAYKGEMDMKSVSIFYHGLEQLIGPPRIVSGSLRTAMQMEHCNAPDSNDRFLRSMSKHAPRPFLRPPNAALPAYATELRPLCMPLPGTGQTSPSMRHPQRSGQSSSIRRRASTTAPGGSARLLLSLNS